MSCNMRACKGSAQSSISEYPQDLNLAQIDMAILTNLLLLLTNHKTFHFSEGGPSSNPELIKHFVSGLGERYCNNVNYMTNNACMRA